MITHKTPKKLYRTKLHRLLGIVSPSLFYQYLLNDDPEVVEFAKVTGYFHYYRELDKYYTDCGTNIKEDENGRE